MRLNVIYSGIAQCSLGDGFIVSFWDNHWSGSALSVQYPRLHSFTMNSSTSVQRLMMEQALV
jgi:hypothetical protein